MNKHIQVHKTDMDYLEKNNMRKPLLIFCYKANIVLETEKDFTDQKTPLILEKLILLLKIQMILKTSM